MTLRAKFERLRRRPFLRDVATIASGTAVSQVISMAFSPVITRLYGAEAYGMQGVFMSFVGILSTVAAMTYPVAIVLPKQDADALGIARLSLYLGVVTALLTTFAFYLFGGRLLSYFDAEEISSVMYLVPVAMFISVVSAVVGQWLIRKRAFMLTAKVTVWQTLLMSAIKAGLGLFHPTAVVLVVTNTLSGLLSSAMMFFGWRRSTGAKRDSNLVDQTRTNAWALAKTHSDFALLRTPQNLINSVSHSLPVMLLATHSGPAAVGYFSIATAVLAMPAGLIGNSFMQVFYPRVTDAIRDKENARALIVKATSGLALTGAIPAIAVIVAGPGLFAFVFGAEWRTAGVYAQWLSVWLLFQYINKPAVCAIPALGLQRGLLIYELFSTGTKVLALYLGFVIFKSDVAAIALFSIFGVLAYGWLILWVIVKSGQTFNASRAVAA